MPFHWPSFVHILLSDKVVGSPGLDLLRFYFLRTHLNYQLLCEVLPSPNNEYNLPSELLTLLDSSDGIFSLILVTLLNRGVRTLTLLTAVKPAP